MKKYFSKEVIIGLITLISLGLLYFGLNYLKGANIFKPTNIYYVRMPDVSELQKSSPVYVNGFRVGIVSDITYDYQSGKNIIVQISLDKKMKVETGSHVEIKTGLTSGGYLNLSLNRYVSSFYQQGDTIDGFSEQGIMDKVSNNLLPQLEIILPRIDSILMGIQRIVNDPALSQSLVQLSATTSNLEKSTRQLNLFLTNDMPPIMDHLNQVSSNFAILSSQFRQMDLNATLNRIDNSLKNFEQMSLQLNRKDNSMGLLLNDRSMYDHLDSAIVNISNVILDFKSNPRRYIKLSVF